jgi:hypothetical protein
VSVSDNCSEAGEITLSQSPAAGTLVGVGTHTITVTATDAAGNSATCTTTFTVETVLSASGPVDLLRYAGLGADFDTSASGTGPFSYQWRKDGVGIAGATNATYGITSVSVADAGTYCVVINGACNSVTNCATLNVNNCLPLTNDIPRMNWLTTRFEQKVWVTNPTQTNLPAVRVFISGLREGVRVDNASGDVDGVSFVTYSKPVGPGETVELTIEYYALDRRTPESELCAKPVQQSSPIQQKGTPVKIERAMWLANGTFMIEFSAVEGQVYHIEYCDDLRTWKTVTPSGTSGANRIQWIDNGQPKTESLPGKAASRFYRVLAAQ